MFYVGGIKNRKKLSNRHLTVKPNADYEIVEKDNPNDQLNIIQAKQNIAYGEVKYPLYI